MVENTNDNNVPEAPAESLPEVTAEARMAGLEAERDRLEAEKAELEDRLLRLRADSENFRRRMERDRSDFVQYAAMDVLRDLLPVLDDFERALKTESAEKDYVKGVELIYQRLSEILRKLGLEPIEAVGKPFDPNLHQALDKVQTDEVEDQTIVQEYQRGYNFKGKLLRPSMVRVAVRP